MMLVCLVLATFTLYPHQFLSFSRSVIAASLFVSSFLFRSEAGYFDLASEEKPLLHTWSLSVEELFYIFFPLLLLTLRSWSLRAQSYVLIGIAVISLAASMIALEQDPTSRSAFFLPYSRAWELMLGALLAYGILPRTGKPMREVAALLGITMICFAVFGFSDATVFPGFNALLPCVGAALVIYAGQYDSSIGGRLLSTPVLVWIGRISYSLYLWHWPLLAFARVRFGEALTPWGVAGIIALSALCASLSTRFIEHPFRGRDGLLSRRQVLGVSVLGLGTLAILGVAGVWSDGWSNRYPPVVARILFGEQDRDLRQKACLNTRPDASGCLYGARRVAPTVALWGDSHAAVFSVMLGELAVERNQSVQTFTMPSCPPAVGWTLADQPWRDNCEAFQRLAMQRILDTSSIHTVLLAARFAGYAIDEPKSGFDAALRRTILELHDAGKRVRTDLPRTGTRRTCSDRPGAQIGGRARPGRSLSAHRRVSRDVPARRNISGYACRNYASGRN